MIVKREDFVIIDKDEATEEEIKKTEEWLKKDAEKGYGGKYVQDSLVIKVFERDALVYISAEWEEEE